MSNCRGNFRGKFDGNAFRKHADKPSGGCCGAPETREGRAGEGEEEEERVGVGHVGAAGGEGLDCWSAGATGTMERRWSVVGPRLCRTDGKNLVVAICRAEFAHLGGKLL